MYYPIPSGLLLGTRGIVLFVAKAGFEPATFGLWARRATAALLRDVGALLPLHGPSLGADWKVDALREIDSSLAFVRQHSPVPLSVFLLSEIQ